MSDEAIAKCFIGCLVLYTLTSFIGLVALFF